MNIFNRYVKYLTAQTAEVNKELLNAPTTVNSNLYLSQLDLISDEIISEIFFNKINEIIKYYKLFIENYELILSKINQLSEKSKNQQQFLEAGFNKIALEIGTKLGEANLEIMGASSFIMRNQNDFGEDKLSVINFNKLISLIQNDMQEKINFLKSLFKEEISVSSRDEILEEMQQYSRGEEFVKKQKEQSGKVPSSQAIESAKERQKLFFHNLRFALSQFKLIEGRNKIIENDPTLSEADKKSLLEDPLEKEGIKKYMQYRDHLNKTYSEYRKSVLNDPNKSEEYRAKAAVRQALFAQSLKNIENLSSALTSASEIDRPKIKEKLEKLNESLKLRKESQQKYANKIKERLILLKETGDIEPDLSVLDQKIRSKLSTTVRAEVNFFCNPKNRTISLNTPNIKRFIEEYDSKLNSINPNLSNEDKIKIQVDARNKLENNVRNYIHEFGTERTKEVESIFQPFKSYIKDIKNILPQIRDDIYDINDVTKYKNIGIENKGLISRIPGLYRRKEGLLALTEVLNLIESKFDKLIENFDLIEKSENIRNIEAQEEVKPELTPEITEEERVKQEEEKRIKEEEELKELVDQSIKEMKLNPNKPKDKLLIDAIYKEMKRNLQKKANHIDLEQFMKKLARKHRKNKLLKIAQQFDINDLQLGETPKEDPLKSLMAPTPEFMKETKDSVQEESKFPSGKDIVNEILDAIYQETSTEYS